MTKKTKDTIETLLAQLHRMFGPPPVLSSEDVEAFDDLLRELLACFGPSDFFAAAMVWDVAVASWEAVRWARQKPLAMERHFRGSIELQLKFANIKGELNKKFADEGSDEAASNPEPVPDHAIQELLFNSATPLQHNRALESSIRFIGQVDGLQAVATARRNKAIEQLAWYEENLSQRLRTVSDAFISDQASAVVLTHEAVPIVEATAETALVPTGEPTPEPNVVPVVEVTAEQQEVPVPSPKPTPTAVPVQAAGTPSQVGLAPDGESTPDVTSVVPIVEATPNTIAGPTPQAVPVPIGGPEGAPVPTAETMPPATTVPTGEEMPEATPVPSTKR
jgi:hypothetical protein